METTQVNVHSQEYMETMARLMSEALESPEGMRALAAAIAAPIEQEIKRKEISSLLLTRHTLPKGERPIYQKKPKVKAYWISNEGEAQEQELGKEEVEFPTHRIHSAPMVDVSVLKNGNIGTLMDIQTSAADEIRKEIDKRTITVISAAVPAANTVEVTGTTLTEEALNEAVSIIEDLELSVKYIVMRGRRFNDLRSWNLDPQTKAELRAKGVIKNYGTGGILLTAAAAMDEILLIPDEEVGKMPVRENLKTEAIEQKTRFKTGWLVWSELGQGQDQGARLMEVDPDDQAEERPPRSVDRGRCGTAPGARAGGGGRIAHHPDGTGHRRRPPRARGQGGRERRRSPGDERRRTGGAGRCGPLEAPRGGGHLARRVRG